MTRRTHVRIARLALILGAPTRRRRQHALTLLVLSGAVMAGCGAGTSPTLSQSAATGARTHYPVKVENCGSTIVFTHAPMRVATNDITTAEDMIALGLGNRIVGSFKIRADQPTGAPEREPAALASSLPALPELSPEEVTLERLLPIKADFLFAGWWNYGLELETEEEPRALERHGIKTLALTESCAMVQPNKPGASMQDTYQDLANLGVIFDVQGRAAALIAQMKRQIAAVHAKVARLHPVSVFLYENDSSDPVTALGLGTPTALIQQAGGSNVFADKKRTWTAVRWSEIAARKPQCIVIDDYAQPSWQQKETLLKNFPIMRNVPAVHNGCIMHLSYDLLAPGPRNAEAVEALARRLHPQAFAGSSGQ